MKNIFIIPTDQPSRLVKIKDTFFITSSVDIPGGTFYNIYITSSEEIIEDDYCYDNFLKSVFKANSIMGVKTQCTSEKIILSTDPTLIADGIQAIDDEFLEWFVKNPTCEFVETQKTQHVSYETNYNGRTTPLYKWVYKIIIPQEEPKQYPIGGFAPGNYMNNCITCKQSFMGDKRATQCETCAIEMVNTKVEVNSKGGVEIVKQETKDIAYWRNNCEEDYLHTPISVLRYISELEKALEQSTLEEAAEKSFISGGKWMEKRMFSKEEVRQIAEWSFHFYKTNEFDDSELEEEWYKLLEERFKKK